MVFFFNTQWSLASSISNSIWWVLFAGTFLSKSFNLVMPSSWWWARILCDNNINHPEGAGAKDQRMDGGNQHTKIIQVDDPFSKLLLSTYKLYRDTCKLYIFPPPPKKPLTRQQSLLVPLPHPWQSLVHVTSVWIHLPRTFHTVCGLLWLASFT